MLAGTICLAYWGRSEIPGCIVWLQLHEILNIVNVEMIPVHLWSYTATGEDIVTTSVLGMFPSISNARRELNASLQVREIKK